VPSAGSVRQETKVMIATAKVNAAVLEVKKEQAERNSRCGVSCTVGGQQIDQNSNPPVTEERN
jgi:hypothetical protein